MKIAILGTRGIPNQYGGFEQFAEYFSVYLVEHGHQVYVYNSDKHSYQEKTYKGVNIIHKYDPEDQIGTSGQFIYDLFCVLDSRKRKFDCILQLGYTSSSIWNFLFSKKSILVTNMDGMEWKRSKFNKYVQRFLMYAEKLAVKHSDVLVSDSIGIQDYIKKKYHKDSTYIAYGANSFKNPDETILREYDVIKHGYSLIIARLEPENNIEPIIDGYVNSKCNEPLIVIGKHNTTFGNYLKEKFKDERIRFIGGVYNLIHLNNLRSHSRIYFHGHSVGGTNPSLLEAMASNTLIVANDNIFNKAILKENAFYFRSKNDISKYVDALKKTDHQIKVNLNMRKIESSFSWPMINEQYEKLITSNLK